MRFRIAVRRKGVQIIELFLLIDRRSSAKHRMDVRCAADRAHRIGVGKLRTLIAGNAAHCRRTADVTLIKEVAAIIISASRKIACDTADLFVTDHGAEVAAFRQNCIHISPTDNAAHILVCFRGGNLTIVQAAVNLRSVICVANQAADSAGGAADYGDIRFVDAVLHQNGAGQIADQTADVVCRECVCADGAFHCDVFKYRLIGAAASALHIAEQADVAACLFHVKALYCKAIAVEITGKIMVIAGANRRKALIAKVDIRRQTDIILPAAVARGRGDLLRDPCQLLAAAHQIGVAGKLRLRQRFAVPRGRGLKGQRNDRFRFRRLGNMQTLLDLRIAPRLDNIAVFAAGKGVNAVLCGQLRLTVEDLYRGVGILRRNAEAEPGGSRLLQRDLRLRRRTVHRKRCFMGQISELFNAQRIRSAGQLHLIGSGILRDRRRGKRDLAQRDCRVLRCDGQGDGITVRLQRNRSSLVAARDHNVARIALVIVRRDGAAIAAGLQPADRVDRCVLHDFRHGKLDVCQRHRRVLRCYRQCQRIGRVGILPAQNRIAVIDAAVSSEFFAQLGQKVRRLHLRFRPVRGTGGICRAVGEVIDACRHAAAGASANRHAGGGVRILNDRISVVHAADDAADVTVGGRAGNRSDGVAVGQGAAVVHMPDDAAHIIDTARYRAEVDALGDFFLCAALQQTDDAAHIHRTVYGHGANAAAHACAHIQNADDACRTAAAGVVALGGNHAGNRQVPHLRALKVAQQANFLDGIAAHRIQTGDAVSLPIQGAKGICSAVADIGADRCPRMAAEIDICIQNDIGHIQCPCIDRLRDPCKLCGG